MHCCAGEPPFIDFVEGTTAFDQPERRLVLMLRLEARQVKLPGDLGPGCRQKLIGPSRGTCIASHHDPIWMFREVRELAPAVEGAVAEVVAVLPRPFCIADGVQQCSALWRDPVCPARIQVLGQGLGLLQMA